MSKSWPDPMEPEPGRISAAAQYVIGGVLTLAALGSLIATVAAWFA